MRRGDVFRNAIRSTKMSPEIDPERSEAWERLYGGLTPIEVLSKSQRLRDLYRQEEELFKQQRALTTDREFRDANRADYKLLHSGLNYTNPYWTGNWNLYGKGDSTQSTSTQVPQTTQVPTPTQETTVQATGKSAINNLFSNLTAKRVSTPNGGNLSGTQTQGVRSTYNGDLA